MRSKSSENKVYELWADDDDDGDGNDENDGIELIFLSLFVIFMMHCHISTHITMQLSLYLNETLEAYEFLYNFE